APMLDVVLRGDAMVQSMQLDRLDLFLTEVQEVLTELFDAPQALGNLARLRAARGQYAEARVVLDRAQALGVDRIPFDAEWLACLYALLETCVGLGHPFAAEVVAASEPYADFVSFEGIGAAVHGSMARVIALAYLATGRIDEAETMARRALAI